MSYPAEALAKFFLHCANFAPKPVKDLWYYPGTNFTPWYGEAMIYGNTMFPVPGIDARCMVTIRPLELILGRSVESALWIRSRYENTIYPRLVLCGLHKISWGAFNCVFI